MEQYSHVDVTDNPSPIEAAKELSPFIRSCAAQIEADRELPRPLFEALSEAGLFHLALPRAVGGAELELPTYIQVLQEIGQADTSTAWIVNQYAIFATYAARIPRDIARMIWIETPYGVVANTFAPTGHAVAVPGGYRVSGLHRFSTGCRHASWFAARARLVENDHEEERYFFVPATEVELLDTWHVRGMRGTGTHDFAVTDVFVPSERTVLQRGAPLLETGPLYRFPLPLLFASGDAALALGAARSCLTAFCELAAAKKPHAMQATLRDQSLVQAAVGQTEAHIRAGKAFVTEAVHDTWAEAESTGALTLDGCATLRLATTHAIRLAVQAIDTIYNGAGTSAIYEGNQIQRHFQDIHVLSQHQQARLSNYELVGKHFLGLPVEQLGR